MRILVVGAGGIGGYFGGRMLAAGQDVTFLVRERRAGLLAQNGLVIRSPRGDLHYPAPPTVQAGAITAPFDAVVLSCKAFDLDSAIESFAPAVGPDTVILPLLNGMRHLDSLAARFGEAAVLGGQCAISTTLDPDGAVRQFGDMQALSLGARSGAATPNTVALAEALAPENGRLSEMILQEMWEKWVFITTIATSTSLLRAVIGDVVAAGATEIPLGLADECIAIATKAGFTPRPAAVERLRGMVSTAGSMLNASMARDIEGGLAVEADHVVGDLLSRANAGAAPLLRVAYLHLKTYEARRAREKGL
jgi:2-dehydropantoate 2-reductase